MTIRLNPVPQTPLRDDPTQDAIWKRFLQFWIDKIQTAGTGTVTSVAQTVPTDILSVAGSPITTSGTLAITKQVQNANKGWFGPTTGADAQPTFRALVTADLPSGTGTVTSVASNFTGGLISVAGSPITTSGTLAFTVAGTSGGIPYFSGATTWASSGALAASAIVLGGGAGNPPATTTTGTGVVTALGVNVGTAGSFITNGGALGTPSSGTVTNLTGTASININGTVGATTANTGKFTSVEVTTGTVGVGTAPVTTDAMVVTKTDLTGTVQRATNYDITGTSAATVAIVGHRTILSTQAASFTCGTMAGIAVANGTKGASSSITINEGFVCEDLTIGTSNYGYRGLISSGTNKYNLFLDGTAVNYMAGALYVGSNTVVNSAAAATFVNTTSATGALLIQNASTSGDSVFAVFGTEASFTTRGTISYNRAGGLTAYNVTSDERAKDVKGIYADSGKAIDSVPVYLGRMKGASLDMPTMKAHELQAVAPYAVTGDRGGKEMQQVSYGALVPLMWAEIQALRKRLALLEAKERT